MSKFLSLNYWFNIWGGALIPYLRNIFIIFIIFLFVLTIIFIFLKKRAEKTLYFRVVNQLQLFLFVNFLSTLLLLFFTDQRIPLLSARFWFLFLVGEFFVWLYFIFKNYKKIPFLKEKIKKDKEYEKYLPKKN